MSRIPDNSVGFLFLAYGKAHYLIQMKEGEGPKMQQLNRVVSPNI